MGLLRIKRTDITELKEEKNYGEISKIHVIQTTVMK